ncbi:cytochrome P450 [Amycolatopsis sp. NBC_00345]|uniref:cytochrome P450 n=1 Tax=Amycolatopsis sp. NBC_00345 TaxID=2975955 RepID=UPI002E26E4F4
MTMTETAAETPVARPAVMPGLPYFGGIARMKSDPLGYLREASGRGPVVLLGRLDRRSFYQVNDANLIRQVMTAPSTDLGMTRTTDVLKALFDKSVFTLQNDAWRRRRAELQPAFRTSTMPELFDVAAGELTGALDRFEAAAGAGEPVDFTAEMLELVQRVIVRMMFGVAVPGTGERLARAFDYGLSYRQRRRWALVKPPLWVPTPANNRFTCELGQLNRHITSIIGAHRAERSERASLLSMLMSCRDTETGESWTDDQLLAELKTIFNTGWLTTTNSLVWLFDLLGRHPGAEARVAAEVAELAPDRPLEFADLKALPFTEAAIMETMRLYPPGWLTSRRVLRPLTLGGVPLRRNTVIIVAQFSLHRDPQYWERPDEFVPDRFEAGSHGGAHKFAFLPFGAGPRVCIGRGVAMMELLMIVAMLLRRFRFSPVDDAPAVLEPLSVLRRKDPLNLHVERR